MFCSKCGTELPENATFCLSCGYRMPDHERVLRSHKRSNTLFLITIAVVILGALALFLILRSHEIEMVRLAARTPSPTPIPSASPSPSPSPSPTPLVDIHAVNFNRMNYKMGEVTVKGTDADIRTVYGDLDHDNQEEAIVTVTYITGGTGAISSGFIYGISDGKLRRITEFDGGDRSNGGIIKASVADGKLLVERCQLNALTRDLTAETTFYQLIGSQLSLLDKKSRKTDSCW